MGCRRSPRSGDLGGICACTFRAIGDPDGVGLELDNKLLDHVFDSFLAIGHLNRTIVFAGSEFALHEDMCAFAEAGCKLRKLVSVRDNIVPLGFVFLFAFVAFPGACGRD